MNMDAVTLTALRGSIAKWRAIVDGTGGDDGSDNCPLCLVFPLSCRGCPVMKKTGRPGCQATPYLSFAELFYAADDEWPHFAETTKQKAAAQAELDFLISLLPEGETP